MCVCVCRVVCVCVCVCVRARSISCTRATKNTTKQRHNYGVISVCVCVCECVLNMCVTKNTRQNRPWSWCHFRLCLCAQYVCNQKYTTEQTIIMVSFVCVDNKTNRGGGKGGRGQGLQIFGEELKMQPPPPPPHPNNNKQQQR